MKGSNKILALLTAIATLAAVMPAAALAKDNVNNDIDMSLVFSPQTQLVVYADGEWSDALSDIYGYGDSVSLSAPAVAGKSFSHWEADGSVISYADPLKLTVKANTTLYAIYENSVPAVNAAAGFTSVTRSDNGNSIVFQAIADGAATAAGIVYSTVVTDGSLMIGGENVTNVAAEKITDATTTMPQSVLDKNNCWTLQITPESEDTVYHARAYATVGGKTTYGDVKDVKLSDLNDGILLIANMEGFEHGINDVLESLANGMNTVAYNANGGIGATLTQGFFGETVTLRTNTFTRDGYAFAGWSTSPEGDVVYEDGQSTALSSGTTLYAQWTEVKIGAAISGYTGKYDGQAHGITVNVTDPASGAIVKYGTSEGEYDLDESPTITNVSDSPLTVYYQIRAKGYTSKTGSETVRINRRSVTLTSATGSKMYDGSPLTNDNVSISGDGFVQGEGANFTVIGTRTVIGVSENEFDYELNNALADNYNITKNNGTLTVTNRDAKYEITLKANGGEYTYDGTEKTVSGIEKTEFVIDGNTYTVSGMTAEAKATDAGEYAVNVTGTPKVEDVNHNDVSDQFAVSVENSKLTIKKAVPTLAESPTASAIRSGNMLSTSTLSGGKVVFGETEVTGAFAWTDGTIRPEVADSESTEYEAVFTPDSDNFEPVTIKMTLKVNKRSSSSVGGGGGGGTAARATEAPKTTEAPEATEAPAATEAPEAAPTAKPAGSKWFKDVPEGLWYYAPIKEAFDNGRMSGMSEDYFEPDTAITRGMFAYAVYRRENTPETAAANVFADVKAGSYYETAIAWAVENGVVKGYDDTHYGPDDPITREQMAAILYRYAQLKNHDVSAGEDTNILDFTDALSISEYAVPAIQWAVGENILTGFEDTTMRPQDNATRAQMAAILNKIAKLF